MRRWVLLLMFFACLPLAVSAQGFRRETIKLPVTAIDANSFEVVERPFAGPPQLWCGAGIFAKRVLGRNSGRIYLEEVYGPAKTVAGGRGAIFTLEEVPGAFTSLGTSYRKVGLNKSIGAATSLCGADPELRIRIRTAQGTFAR